MIFIALGSNLFYIKPPSRLTSQIHRKRASASRMTILLSLKGKKRSCTHTHKRVLSTKPFLFLLFPAWCILVVTIVLAFSQKKKNCLGFGFELLMGNVIFHKQARERYSWMALSSGKEEIRNEAMEPFVLTAFLLLWCIPTVPSPVASAWS